MVSEAKVRLYEPRDALGVFALAEKYASWDATPTLRDIQGFHSQNPALFFVAEVENGVVGFVYGRESNPPAETLLIWKANKAGFIESLAVAEEHRRKGVATALLTRFFQACRNKGIDIISLGVPVEEEGARKLYSRLGFEVRAYHLRRKL